MQYCRFKTINIGIAVYNEDKTLKRSLTSLINDLDSMTFKETPTVYICFNGCSDGTINKFLELRKEIKYPVRILSSPKGKIRAHKRIIDEIGNDLPVIFIDADILFKVGTIRKVIDELIDSNRRIVCAYPYSIKPSNLSIIKKILYGVINIKRIHPKIEIARKDVSKFHPREKDKFLKHSRIYFHGRFFAIRDKEVYVFPEEDSGIVGDDTFLSFVTLYNYPFGSIKVLYDTKVYSKPQLSIKAYLKSWFRIRKDLANIYKTYPEFNNLKKYVKMKINWEYVLKDIPMEYKIYAILFSLLRTFEAVSYFLLSKKINALDIWSYKEKPGELR
ncbi:glycosyltransferase [Nanoarchaeota archaeon]